MELCKDCGAPLDDAGLTNCGGKGINADLCDKDRTAFFTEVTNMKLALNPHILASMEKNDMPACFGTSRPLLVALAQLLMEALRQNEELLKHVPKH